MKTTSQHARTFENTIWRAIICLCTVISFQHLLAASPNNSQQSAPAGKKPFMTHDHTARTLTIYNLDPTLEPIEASRQFKENMNNNIWPKIAKTPPQAVTKLLEKFIIQRLEEQLTLVEKTYYMVDLQEVDRTFATLLYQIETNPFLQPSNRAPLLGKAYFLCGLNALAMGNTDKAKHYLAYYKHINPPAASVALETHPAEIQSFVKTLEPTTPPARTVSPPMQAHPLYALDTLQALALKDEITKTQTAAKAPALYILPIRKQQNNETSETEATVSRLYIGYNPLIRASFKISESDLAQNDERTNAFFSRLFQKSRIPGSSLNETATQTDMPIAPLAITPAVAAGRPSSFGPWLKQHWYVPAAAALIVGAAAGYIIYSETETAPKTITIQLPPKSQKR